MSDLDAICAGFAGGALAGFAVAATVFMMMKEQIKDLRMQVVMLWAEVRGGEE